jgi:glycosyltransferase involved in cell wall biosynthesis
MRNAEKYIEETIQSLLQQTYSNIELIIINDGSTDKSEELVKSFSDQRIRIFQGQERGISAALNLGLKSALGDYVCRCDSDDIFPLDRLTAQLDWLSSNPNYIAVSGKFTSMDEKSRIVAEFNTGESFSDITSELLSGITRTHLCTFLINKNVLDGLAGFREFFVTAEDIDMQLLLAEKGLIGYLPENMYFYRIHDNSITHEQSSSKRIFYENSAREFLKQRLERGQDDVQKENPPIPPNIKDAATDSGLQIMGYLMGESWRLHNEKNKYAAFKISLRACRLKPLNVKVWKNILMILIKP